MNRNFLKPAILATAILAGTTVGVAKQYPTTYPPYYNGIDFQNGAYAGAWVWECRDVTKTTHTFYSTDYIGYINWNDLAGVFLGIHGSATFEACPNSVSAPLPGRIGFMTGPRGSAQDEVYPANKPVNLLKDSWLLTTMGMPDAVGGNFAYAKTVKQVGTATPTRVTFGSSAIDTFYFGDSDRYFHAESTQDGIRVILRCDILGDSARLDWQLFNTGATASIGLEYGMWVNFLEPYAGTLGSSDPAVIPGTSYWYLPGYKPLLTDQRFAVTPLPNDAKYGITDNAMPPYLLVGVNQSDAYGIKLPMIADNATPDQTPVDILDIGKAGFLLGITSASDTPMPAADSTPPPILPDTTFSGEPAFVERWKPVSTPAGGKREIVNYFRNTWSVSDYSQPYSVVIDPPNVVGTSPSNPFRFTVGQADAKGNPNPGVIRVYIDNTRGFSTSNQAIPLTDVRVTMTLPTGITDADDATNTSTTITKYIASVPPTTHTTTKGFNLFSPMSYLDFKVNIAPTLSGNQNFTVKIEATPAPTKTITGTIIVASQPYLRIAATGNLIGVPWSFSNTDWSSILGSGSNPLVQDEDFQVYSWDATQQQYVLQTGPVRGQGAWIVSTKDAGFKPLAGNPQAPTTLFSGNVHVKLKSGWNLIANPYNYQIQVGQLVGVAGSNNTTTQTFADLAGQGIVSSSLAYWDQNGKNYQFTTDFTDVLYPNRGYWIYVSTAEDVDLYFPAVSIPFLPATGTVTTNLRHVKGALSFQQPQANWKLNLSVTQGKVSDLNNYVGVLANPTQVIMARVPKPPVAPLAGTVSAAVKLPLGSKSQLFAQSLIPDGKSLSWDWQIYTASAGATKVTWPNLTQVPAKVSLKLTDVATGQVIDLRKTSSFSFLSKSRSNRLFKITATTVN